MQTHKTKGFTLIELIIVVTIIAVLSSVAYFSFSQYSTDAENTKKKTELNTIQSKIELEILKEESFPSKLK